MYDEKKLSASRLRRKHETEHQERLEQLQHDEEINRRRKRISTGDGFSLHDIVSFSNFGLVLKLVFVAMVVLLIYNAVMYAKELHDYYFPEPSTAQEIGDVLDSTAEYFGVTRTTGLLYAFGAVFIVWFFGCFVSGKLPWLACLSLKLLMLALIAAIWLPSSASSLVAKLISTLMGIPALAGVLAPIAKWLGWKAFETFLNYLAGGFAAAAAAYLIKLFNGLRGKPDKTPPKGGDDGGDGDDDSGSGDDDDPDGNVKSISRTDLKAKENEIADTLEKATQMLKDAQSAANRAAEAAKAASQAATNASTSTTQLTKTLETERDKANEAAKLVGVAKSKTMTATTDRDRQMLKASEKLADSASTMAAKRVEQTNQKLNIATKALEEAKTNESEIKERVIALRRVEEAMKKTNEAAKKVAVAIQNHDRVVAYETKLKRTVERVTLRATAAENAMNQAQAQITKLENTERQETTGDRAALRSTKREAHKALAQAIETQTKEQERLLSVQKMLDKATKESVLTRTIEMETMIALAHAQANSGVQTEHLFVPPNLLLEVNERDEEFFRTLGLATEKIKERAALQKEINRTEAELLKHKAATMRNQIQSRLSDLQEQIKEMEAHETQATYEHMIKTAKEHSDHMISLAQEYSGIPYLTLFNGFDHAANIGRVVLENPLSGGGGMVYAYSRTANGRH